MRRSAGGRIAGMAVCIAGLVLLVSCASSDPDEQEWLLLQTAIGGGYADGTLTLEGVAYTVAFTDRPGREVAHMANDSVAEAWGEGEDSFADDPPNAALGYDIGDTSGQAVVQLNEIIVDGDRITYQVDTLEGELPNGDFDRATLVIDALGLITPSDQGRP